MYDIIVFDNRLIHAFIHLSRSHSAESNPNHQSTSPQSYVIKCILRFCLITELKRIEASTQGVQFRKDTTIPVHVTRLCIQKKLFCSSVVVFFVVVVLSLYFLTESGPK